MKRFSAISMMAAAVLGLSGAAHAQFVYPSFTVNATSQRSTITLSGNMIPPLSFATYQVSMDWSTATFQNGISSGARFWITDRAPSFFGFPLGTVVYVESGAAPNSAPNTTARSLLWTGSLRQTYVGGNPIFLTIQQSPGLGATFANFRVQLNTSAPTNDTPAAPAEIPAPASYPAVTPAQAMLGASVSSAGEPALCVPAVRTVWYRFTPTETADYTFETCAGAAPLNNVNNTVAGIFAANGERLACSGSTCGTRSSVTATMQAGTTYLVAVGRSLAGDLPITENSYQLAITRSATTPSTPNIGCRADIVDIGGLPPGDGRVTADDYIAFFNNFAAGVQVCDVTDVGGQGDPDGLVTADDFVFFLNAFAQGCP